MKKIVFLLLLKLIAVPLVNGSDEVEKKIFFLTKQIINAYNNLELKEFRDTIAIVTFDEPAEKGLGVGVSELIITELSKSGILHIEAGYFYLRNREEYEGYEYNLDLTGPLLGASLLMYF